MATHALIWALAVVLVLLGFAGTVLPALPGVPMVFAGLLLAAWADDFQRVTWVTLVILGVLTALSLVIDLMSAVIGARRVGASRQAIIGCFIGTLVGIFFGIAGLILGPFIGAAIGEFLSNGEIRQASRVGVATWIGLIVGTLARLSLAFMMVGIFAVAYFI